MRIPSLGAGVVAILAFAVLTLGGSPGQQGESLPGGIGARSAAAPAGHVGSKACAGCHERQAKDWASSHHAHAMATATGATVRGDFSGPSVTVSGSKGRFFRDGERYMVETEGRDGKPATFAVSHTFGWEPLQQYLVTFPDGRLQALPWAWDTRPADAGGQRWFHVYGDEPILPSDSRHWTRYQQNWNHMCAECHSTALDKGYDAAADVFRTTWSEISVGCESCHGGGRGHVDWVAAGARPDVPLKGFAAREARRAAADWTPDPSTGSPRGSVARPSGDEVETCARCHARRGQVGTGWKPGQLLGDTHLPAFLTPDLFEDDGMMRDEVFNDHSFKQSLMYARGVTCGDCHDAHSGKLKAAGAVVCNQCHLAERFEAAIHTGHAPGPKAPDCISCHMPARTYMVVDTRHDHSFRIPRPDISATLGTPNACNDCHADRPASWSAEAVERWHGPRRKGHQTYADAFHASRTGDLSARERLIRVATDLTAPDVARATAVLSLRSWPSADSEAVAAAALSSPDPLTRVAALRLQDGQSPDVRWRRGGAALADPVLIVRLAAAMLLADQNPDARAEPERARLRAAFAEYEAAQRLDADRTEGRAAMAVFRLRQGRLAEAEAEYLAALRLEPAAATVSVNLSDLYRQQGREDAAEQVLRAAVMIAPTSAVAHHALGLSLIRSKRYADALHHLRLATENDLANARFAYVHVVALQSTGQAEPAAQALREAFARHPADADIVAMLLQQTMQAGDAKAAAPLAERLAKLRPDDAAIARLAARLRQ